jgi:glycerol-3-phosphate acyltransferase
MAVSSTAQGLFTALLSAGTAALRPPPRDDRPHPTVHACVPPASRLAGATLVVDVDGALLHRRSPLSLFPYFMLVTLEAGGFLRGLALLLLYPVIAGLLLLLPGGGGGDLAVRAMAAAAFCGLRAGAFRAGRAVLPRWLLEDVAAEALRVALRRGGAGGDPARVVWASAMPRVMVEPFLREYLLVPPAAAVAAREMKTLCGFYTGVMAGGDGCGKVISELRKKKAGDDDNNVVGFSGGGSMEFLRRPLASICKVPVK